MKTLDRRNCIQRSCERGQALILFVGIFSVVLVIAAIVVDFGLWFAERRSAQRGADLAAAAGALDLPADNGSDEALSAFTNACAWAEANGYETGVEVVVFSRGDDPDLTPCGAPVTSCSAVCDTVRVTVSNSAPRLFTALPFFEIDPFDVGAVAAAGLTSGGTGGVGGVGADQTVLLIQAHRRLGQGLFCLPDGRCAIDLLLAEAHELVSSLAGGAGAEVAYAPYTHCYQPDPGYPALDGRAACVPMTWVAGPTASSVALHAAIDETVVVNSGTENICLALLQAQNMLAPAAEGRRQSIILVSDGDNRFQYTSFFQSIGYPPAGCRPDLSTDQPLQGLCDPPAWRERELDELTLQKADELNDAGVEIYVVALWSDFEPCGLDSSDPNPNCDQVGNADHDNIANERLLRCIATSPDHYTSVNFVDLPETLEEIASEIVSRSLLQ